MFTRSGNKIRVTETVEFHITNVCNLTCYNCNRFSNHKFSGFQRWEDYKQIYQDWGENINIELLAILGGEPLLNPTFLDWLKGLRNIWPESYISITTNGTRLDKIPGFYEEVLKHKDKTLIDISVHSNKVEPYIYNALQNFIEPPLDTVLDNNYFVLKHLRKNYDQIKGTDWPNNWNSVYDLPASVQQEIIENFIIIQQDKNGVKVNFGPAGDFSTVGVYKKDKDFYLHNSDPNKAHNVCMSKDCHQFYKGRLFKCSFTALISDFETQNPIKLSNSDKMLVHNATDGYLDANATQKQIEDLKKYPIQHCRFCPENLYTQSTNAEFKSKP